MNSSSTASATVIAIAQKRNNLINFTGADVSSAPDFLRCNMQTLTFQLNYTENTLNSNALPVIVVAAGSSTRMKGIAKPFATLKGIPVIVRTLLSFQNSSHISNIILVTKKDYIPEMQKYCDEYMISKVSDIVEGGSNRQESVFNGLRTVKNADKVLIHDGARPLISKDLIERIAVKLQSCDGVICAVKSKDTVKNVNSQGIVNLTYNRDELYCVQTPQGADVKKYLALLENADLSVFTDDASILESAKIPVYVVDGEYTNIKITTPDDLALAEFYLEKMGENL